ncbi:MAG: hypothetical protein EKK29_19890 [Hyphomicrobiales bacterium]|nr:MAG: hypothetical protein EKK29_19890 [Hyphomicrobiales bacterium]
MAQRHPPPPHDAAQPIPRPRASWHPARRIALMLFLNSQVVHAKIGELTLENDFLSGAPGQAGPSSAKR